MSNEGAVAILPELWLCGLETMVVLLGPRIMAQRYLAERYVKMTWKLKSATHGVTRVFISIFGTQAAPGLSTPSPLEKVLSTHQLKMFGNQYGGRTRLSDAALNLMNLRLMPFLN